MNNKSTLFTSFILILMLISSCSILPSSGKEALNGTSWKLVSYGAQLPLDGSVMTANFSSNEIQGSASCNHYFGSFRLSGENITIEGLGWTEMACLDPEGIMEQEQTLMNLLSMASEYRIDGNQLLLKTTDGNILIFERMAD